MEEDLAAPLLRQSSPTTGRYRERSVVRQATKTKSMTNNVIGIHDRCSGVAQSSWPFCSGETRRCWWVCVRSRYRGCQIGDRLSFENGGGFSK